MQPMQNIFNSRMEPIQTREEYPKYARSETKPVVRARQIIDQGVISDRPCSTCVDLKQDCYRWEGPFSKCAYCTSKDRRKELCHLPGEEAPAASSQQERRKRRKITHNIYAPSGDAASTPDTTMSGILVTDPLAPATTTPIPVVIPASKPKSLHSSKQTSTTTMTGTTYPQAAAAPASSSEATCERITALENKVSSLEATVLTLLVRPHEVSSCSGCSSTTRKEQEQQEQATTGASAVTSDVTFQNSQHLSSPATTTPPPPQPTSANKASATSESVVEGPKLQDAAPSSLSSSLSPAGDITTVEEEDAGISSRLQHSIEHPEGYRPVNCSCTAGM